MSNNGNGPRLIFDKHWTAATTFVSDIVNVIGSTVGARHFVFGRRPPMPIAGVAKRVAVAIQLRKTDAASSVPRRETPDDHHPRLPTRSVWRFENGARSLYERIRTHIIPLAQLFDDQKPATFRGWYRACLDHFIRRYCEADQEAANADYKPVFLEAERATVEVKRLRPRRMARPVEQPVESTPAVAASLPPSKQNLAALKGRAPTLLPLLKGNERVVFDCLCSGDVTSQRDIASATGLTEGAVSKILDRIISKAG